VRLIAENARLRQKTEMFEETEKHFALVRQELQNLAEKQSEEGNVLEDAMAKINEFEKRSKVQ